MAGSGVSGSSSSSHTSHQAAPKILLAKPSLVSASKFNRVAGNGGPDDDSVLRPRLPSIGSLNLLSDSWDFSTDRFLPVILLSLKKQSSTSSGFVFVPNYYS